MILDIVLIVLLLLGGFIGYKRGFVKVVIKLATFILAIVLGFLLQPSVADFIGESLGFSNTISTAIEDKLSEVSDNDGEKEINIPVLEKTLKEIEKVSQDKKAETISNWSEKISDFVIKGISFIAIFLVVSILMGIIALILDTVVQLPVLKTLNGTIGAGIEVVLVLLGVLVVLAIISFLSPLDMLNVANNYINESCIIKWLYENNIIVSIIGKKIL